MIKKNTLLVCLYFLPLALYSNESTSASMAKSASKYIGIPYVYGGNSLTKGIDCSAFVKKLVKSHTGINLPRTAHNQALKTKKCSSINSFRSLKIGDAIYFKNSKNKIHHVALVTGFDKDGYPFITHAKGEKYGIVREKINMNYINSFFLAKRFSSVFEQENEKIYIPLLLKNL